MKKIINNIYDILSKYPFYPLIIGVFPVINRMGIYSTPDLIKSSYRVFLIYIIISLLIFWGSHFVYKKISKAALFSICILLPLHYLGPDTGLPKWLSIYDYPFWGQIIVLILFLFLISLIFYSIKRAKQITNHVTVYLNLLSVIWLLFPIISIIKNAATFLSDPYNLMVPSWAPYTTERKILNKPDIYYIILDGYARTDVLSSVYNFDNSEFINFLSQKDFFIANNSRSNYLRTHLSLASSLNSEYLDYLYEAPNSLNGYYELKLFEDNRISDFLRTQGYTIYNLDSGFGHSRVFDSDVFLTPSKGSFLNEFENNIINYSFWGYLRNLRIHHFQETKTRAIPYDEQRKRIRFTFEQLGNLSTNESPKMVFAHVVAPHPPFVFDSTGKPIYPNYKYYIGDGDNYPDTKEDYLLKYPQQLSYINKLVKNAILEILAKSKTDPIIIIQGDHGPGLFLDLTSLEGTCIFERASILNAYHLPGIGSDEILYSTITPVNTFRVVLDNYFSTNLGLLDDKTYYALGKKEHFYVDVTNNDVSNCDK